MTGWKAVWTIARFGWKRDWMGVLITFLFAMYVGGTVGFTLQQLLGGKEKLDSMYVLVDWMYLMTFPVFGQLMNRTSFAVWRDDVYTKKIAQWRTMPIPVEAIVKARLLSTMLQIPALGIPFLALQYGIAPALREQVSPLQWLAFGVIWISYAITVNAAFVWMELGFTGKRYVMGCTIFMLTCVLVAFALKFAHIQLLRETLFLIQSGKYGWLSVFIVLAAAATAAGYRLTVSRMRNRSYVF